MSPRPFGGPKTGIDHQKFDFPARIRQRWERLGTCSGHLKTVTGDLDGRRVSPAHRGRKIVARCSGGDPLWQDVAQGRVRYERFWALLTTVGGEAVWGVIKRRFGDHTGPRVEDERC